MKTADLLLFVRGYATEFIASGIFVSLVGWLLPAATVVNSLHDVSGRLAVLTGGLMAASFGLLGIYFSQTSSEFGKYLSWRGVSIAYLAAFGIAPIYHIITTLALVFMSESKLPWLAFFCVFMLGMSLLNVLSLIGNVSSVIKLRDTFNKEVAENDR